MMKSSVRPCLILILAAAALCPATAKPPAVPELAKKVEIRRTQYGIPHIIGETDGAVAFGFGYCQAEDHLLAIMRLIIQAKGESAKHFGESHIQSDFYNKQFRVYDRAMEVYPQLSAEFREVTEGFVGGINYYIELNRAALPEWVQPITPIDATAHGIAGVMRFAFNRGGIIQRFLAKQKKQTAMAPPEENEDSHGSNMWAFSPDRITTKHAVLMGNPHQGWADVSTYYEAHLTVPGKMNFYGSTFIGRPVLTSGFNDSLGWSHTVNYPDLEEIYELDAKDDTYLFDGKWMPIFSEDKTVESKSGEGLKSETRKFYYTPLGPVILKTNDRIYVIKSASCEQFRYYEEWFKLTRTNNFKQFREVLDMLAIPMFNICYADREGNIFYLSNGTVPKLPHEAHNDEAVHAAGSKDVWTSIHPVSELPQLFNPKGGYVQNCNSPGYLTNLHEPLDPKKFPSYFSPNALSLRTQHSLELIHDKGPFTLEQVRDMKFSPRMLLADRVKDALIAAVERSSPTPETLGGLAFIKGWDNTVTADSRGSVLFDVWWKLYAADESNPSASAFEVPWSADDPMKTPRGLGDPKAAAETFAKAVLKTRETYGQEEVSWGEVHRVSRGNVDAPVSGGSGFEGCFRVLDFQKYKDNKLKVVGGDSWIFAVEFSDPPKAYSVIGYSQSSNAASPHYNDQTQLFAENKMKPVAFTEADIKTQLIKSYRP